MIICGFPGVGKSFCAKNKNLRFNVDDHDSLLITRLRIGRKTMLTECAN